MRNYRSDNISEATKSTDSGARSNKAGGFRRHAVSMLSRLALTAAAAAFTVASFSDVQIEAYAAESTRTIGYDVTKNTVAGNDLETVTSSAQDDADVIHTEKYTPISTAKYDAYTRFGGGSLTMLANKDNDAQNMSFIFDTGEGLIVVDGGWDENGESLLKEIKARGGHVSAWLITHAHRDHAMALAYILNNHPNDISIDGIYYSFFDRDWYNTNDYESVMVYDALTAGFNNISKDKLHSDIKGGDVIEVGKAKVQVLNNAYKLKSNSGNSSSVCYMISMNGTNVVFLGDLTLAAGQYLMNDIDLASLKCDIVQVAHHGQEGVGFAFYQQLAPKVMLWPTPAWLWNYGSSNSGAYGINATKAWQSGLLVQEYYVAKDGDVTLR